jgi:hypothetical protein
MTEQLDTLLEKLAAEPPDHSLDSLEIDLASSIDTRRAQTRLVALLAPVEAGAVTLALAIGLAAGGFAATTTPHALEGLSSASALSPSSLLEGRP